MNGVSKGTSGTVNLGTVLTSHQDISGKENTTNKVTSLSSSSTDTQYPSAKCVYDALQQPSGQGVMYIPGSDLEVDITLSEIKNYNVFLIDAGDEPSFLLSLPSGDATTDGRTVKLILMSGDIQRLTSTATIVCIGSVADPSTGINGTCVLEATYY